MMAISRRMTVVDVVAGANFADAGEASREAGAIISRDVAEADLTEIAAAAVSGAVVEETGAEAIAETDGAEGLTGERMIGRGRSHLLRESRSQSSRAIRPFAGW
jgi:hypothetical protein